MCSRCFRFIGSLEAQLALCLSQQLPGLPSGAHHVAKLQILSPLLKSLSGACRARLCRTDGVARLPYSDRFPLPPEVLLRLCAAGSVLSVYDPHVHDPACTGAMQRWMQHRGLLQHRVRGSTLGCAPLSALRWAPGRAQQRGQVCAYCMTGIS